MKVIDAGSCPLSNADVLQWIKAKRSQITSEDASDTNAGLTPRPRPKNFLSAIAAHERVLTSTKYPYTRNPAAYDSTYDAMYRFDEILTHEIVEPFTRQMMREALADGTLTKEEAEKKAEKETEKKELSETEHMALYNLAPTVVELMDPCVESCEERFTPEEKEIIVRAVREVYLGEKGG